MAAVEAVPELADGGFWYHVATEYVVVRATGLRYRDENNRWTDELGEFVVAFADILPAEKYSVRPVMPVANLGWCAWWMNDGTVVVRSPVPIIGVDTVSLSAADKLVAAGVSLKPFGRVGGR